MASAGIMRFAKKKVQCLGCRQPLEDAAATLCAHCLPKARPQPSLAEMNPERTPVLRVLCEPRQLISCGI